MKTTVNIPDQALKELIKNSKTSTKKDAIMMAINDFNQKRRLAKLSTHLGTFEDLISAKELMKLRESTKK